MCRSRIARNGFAGLEAELVPRQPRHGATRRQSSPNGSCMSPSWTAGGGNPRRSQVPRRRMRHLSSAASAARADISLKANFDVGFWHAALLAGCAGGSAEFDHRRRHPVGPQGTPASRIRRGRQIFRLPVAALACRRGWHQVTGYLPITRTAYDLTPRARVRPLTPRDRHLDRADQRCIRPRRIRRACGIGSFVLVRDVYRGRARADPGRAQVGEDRDGVRGQPGKRADAAVRERRTSRRLAVTGQAELFCASARRPSFQPPLLHPTIRATERSGLVGVKFRPRIRAQARMERLDAGSWPRRGCRTFFASPRNG